jgi:hypothetical protein
MFIFLSCSEKKTEVNKTDSTSGKVKQTDSLKDNAQKNTFKITHASKNYSFTIEPSDAKSTQQNVKILVKRVNEDKPLQEIQSASCNYSMNDSTKLPSVNDEKGIQALIVNDFNFDGFEDLAVQNGEPVGLQATHRYDIYLYSGGKNNFELNKDLTKLAEQGMFNVDIPNKQLSIFYVSGCCYHETKKYEVKNNVPVWFYSEVLNETGKDPEIQAYTKTLINGKWKKGVIKKQ